MQLGTRQECIGRSPWVLGVCQQNGTREFVGRRPSLTRRLSGVAERLTGRWEGLEVDVFSANPDNLSVSLDLLSANSLAPSWQAPGTLGKLPTHSKRVAGCGCGARRKVACVHKHYLQGLSPVVVVAPSDRQQGQCPQGRSLWRCHLREWRLPARVATRGQ
ncbi:hypothetical protein GW17_00019562 [Ensete ventricosum]|nr:hypothetical protein GW17_00019562 [Ensete ventricosum]RZR92111.1 hypothetical protein BHM03_00020361 [Ensete ventricosum]